MLGMDSIGNHTKSEHFDGKKLYVENGKNTTAIIEDWLRFRESINIYDLKWRCRSKYKMRRYKSVIH